MSSGFSLIVAFLLLILHVADGSPHCVLLGGIFEKSDQKFVFGIFVVFMDGYELIWCLEEDMR